MFEAFDWNDEESLLILFLKFCGVLKCFFSNISREIFQILSVFYSKFETQIQLIISSEINNGGLNKIN